MLTSRIDYADPDYAALAEKAQCLWRSEWGADNRYHEVGLVLTAERGKEAYVIASYDNVKAMARQPRGDQKGDWS